MRIRYMRELIAIKEHGNFSRAAESLFITQPALSRHIADMEKELGIRLLNRDKHKVEFTEAGTKVYNSFRRILQTYDNLTREFSDYKLGTTGSLRLGMLYYTISQDFGNVMTRFAEEYPKVVIKRYSCQPQEVFHALAEDRIDIGVLPRANYSDGSFLKFQDITHNGMEVMMAATHPLARKETVSLDDLRPETCIYLRDDPYSNQSYDEALHRCGFEPKKTVYTENIDTVPFVLQKEDAVYIKAAGFNIVGFEQEIVTRRIACSDLRVTKSYAYRADNHNPLIPIFLGMAKDSTAITSHSQA